MKYIDYIKHIISIRPFTNVLRFPIEKVVQGSTTLNNSMWNKSIIYLDTEPTSICNAACPMCARNVNGEGLNPYLTLKSLTLDWFEKNIEPNKIKQLKKLRFGGNVGDPAATPELIPIIKYFKKHNPEIIIGLNTNGGLKNANWWKQLGESLQGPLDYCVFSVDGLEDINHIHRRNVIWKKLMENIKSYISTGASAHWDMLIFKHNVHQLEAIKTLAKQMGFTWFRGKATDRWDTYTKDLGLEPSENYVIPQYDQVDIICERDKDRSLFLDYTGKFWPCCHMAEAYLNVIGYELHKDLREYTNKELFDVYSNRLDNNPFYICKRACNTTHNKVHQFKIVEQLQ